MTVLAQVLREAARRFPERRALVHGGSGFTYGGLDAVTDQVAAGLARRGVRPGHLVALVLPSGLEYVVAYTALARLGAVTTGVGPRYTPTERAAILDRAAPDLVLATEELTEGVPAGPEHIRCVPAAAAHDVWAALRRDEVPPAPPVTGDRDPDLPETVVFTSGTTGTPKGALFTSRQITAITAMDTGDRWGEGGPQLIATGLPHVGFMTKLAGYLKMGATLHLLGRWRAQDALRLVAREKIPYLGGVAAQVSLLLGRPEFDRYDLTHVRGLIVGGGPSPAPLVHEARTRFGAGYSIRYSSTESGGLGTLTAFDAPDSEALHTVGRPRPGTELEIRHPRTGTVLPVGEEGQICLRSPAVMAGYWRDPEAGAALDGDGRLYTGDLGRIDEAGCLRITGRMTEMYIRGGYNVYPQEVEAVLLDHPDVASVAVVPRPSRVMGEIGVAVVVSRAASEPSLAALREFAASRLSAHKLPEAIRIVPELPLTGMDKVDRRSLTEREKSFGDV
ncbi:class I adenylate-forming enzyme family protein [Embleya scabrispora]|uniref:class I adenylate-forming enzyme family protein n=1 Tax=Embleya scabrispora TaxID=159449 RepID=UPI00037CF8D2|nr:class I adenylate-forming enzyme family protein [Embleya scabrispora]MYS81378.1 AMP-binding protein [Streptomyces sp. SID5474]